MIEPGDEITIEYGNSHTMPVRALTLNQQRRLSKLVIELTEVETNGKGLQLFDIAFDCLVLCVGAEKAEELADEIDGEMAIDIASKTLGKQQLSEDDKKKPASSL